MRMSAVVIGSIVILVLAGMLVRTVCIDCGNVEICQTEPETAGLRIVGSLPGKTAVPHFEDTRYDTGIDLGSPPHIEVTKSVDTDEIWQKNDYRSPRNTTVRLAISGEGNPAIDFNSQDVVFTIDCSTSMNQADPTYMRRDAAKSYVNELIPPDRAAVISFSDSAKLVGGHHLSSDYESITLDLNELENGGQTNFTAAIELTNREFAEHGYANRTQVCILLTDGKPEPLETNVTLDVINETIGMNVTIYTIGLYSFGSSSRIDEDLLRWIARKTGGEYFIARRPTDLISIYDRIAERFRNYTAGYDPDILDGEPMVRDVVAPGFIIDHASFSREPDAIYSRGENLTVLEWNISRMEIGQNINISYNLSSTLHGRASLHPLGIPRMMYYLGEDRYEVFFPALSVMVLSSVGDLVVPPPPPPPPPPVPPPPPPGGYPIPITSPVPPTVVPLTTPTGLPAAATPTVLPVEYFIAGFVGLGILERINLKKRLVSRQKVAVGT